jgi:arsenate reductase
LSERTFETLFLCIGNSARSIMAEALLNHWGKGRFRGHSAGSQPKAEVNPLALRLLRSLELPTQGLRSKSWDEFAVPGAPAMDFVITVCDQAAGESCPVWPGRPMVAHWSIGDPAAAEGSEAERMRAFHLAFRELERRITAFVNLRAEGLDRLTVAEKLRELADRHPSAA